MNKSVDWNLMDRELKKLDRRSQVRFALACGSVLHYNKDASALINAVVDWLEGRASESDIEALMTDEMRWSMTGTTNDVANLIAETVLVADSHLSASYAAESAYAAQSINFWPNPKERELCFKQDLMRYLWELVNVDSVIYETILEAR